MELSGETRIVGIILVEDRGLLELSGAKYEIFSLENCSPLASPVEDRAGWSFSALVDQDEDSRVELIIGLL